MIKTEEEIKVPIQVQCPYCGEHTVVTMCLTQDRTELIEKIATALEQTNTNLNVAAVYDFNGFETCHQCNRIIVTSLTVSAHDPQ